MSKTVSPSKAAQIAGVSRWTIIRAIQKSEIEGLRDNRNHWQVNEKSLQSWCDARDARDAHTVHAQEDAHQPAQPDPQVIGRMSELETENRMLYRQLDDIKQDRDAWKDQAQRLSEHRPGFWETLFGRRN